MRYLTDAISRLIAAYGKESLPEDRVATYLEELADIQEPLLNEAVRTLIRRSKFFPSIAEIRHTAASLAGLLPPTPAETAAIIRRADRTEIRGAERGGRGYVEKFWDWPADLPEANLALIQGVLAKVGEPSNSEGKPHFGWEMGFQKTYELAAGEYLATTLADLSRARLKATERVSMLRGG